MATTKKTAKKTTASKKAVTETASKKEHAVPAGLAPLDLAIQSVAAKIDGRYCYGLPGYTGDTKVLFKLVPVGDLGLFDENEVDRDEWPGWVPFASLKGEPQFLAIQSAAPHAVGMWEHEDGKIHPTWPSLEAFAARVIDKKDQTPSEILEALVTHVSALIEKDQHAQALALIEPAIQALPDAAGSRADDRDGGRAFNLYGLALKGVSRLPEARAAFARASAGGTSYAELNILGILDDLGDAEGIIAHVPVARKAHFFDDYGRVWVSRYLAGAYLDVGDPEKAELELRKIKDSFEVTAPAKVTEARAGIEEYIAKKRPGAAHATAFLDWLKPKSYEVSPAEAKANRAWWDGLTEPMRSQLQNGIEQAGVSSLSDEDVARAKDVTKLALDKAEGSYDDVTPFLQLARLARLSFYGDPDSIEPLRQITALKRLTINNRVIKDFAWSSRADRDLRKAAEAEDRAGILAALAAGANVNARGDSGKGAIHHAAMKHNVELCTLLVERGADPWAGTHHGSDGVMSFFGDEAATNALVAAAAKAGIPHPDGAAWRELSVKREPAAATFEIEGKLRLELDEGKSLAAAWPADVTFGMKAPKKENKLYDVLRVGYRAPVVSERFAAALRDVPGIELLPVKLVDHAKKPVPGPYFLLNPLELDALDVAQCYPQWNHIDPESITEAAAWVLDPAKVAGAQLFRPARLNGKPMIIAKDLADKLSGFSGVRIGHLRR